MDKREYRYFMTYDQDASGAAVNTKNVFVTEGVVCDVKISLNLPVTSLEAMILMNKENLQSAHIQINIAKKHHIKIIFKKPTFLCSLFLGERILGLEPLLFFQMLFCWLHWQHRHHFCEIPKRENNRKIELSRLNCPEK